MKDLLVRTHTLTMPTSRLVVMVLFAALLSAVPFHAALAQSAPDLGRAGSFAVLGGAAVTCTGPFAVTGDVGSVLGAMTFPCTIFGGTVYPPTDSIWALHPTPYDDFLVAYAALAPSAVPDSTCDQTFTDTTLASTTFAPGVYCFNSFLAEAGTTFTLDGPSDGIWIFKIGTGDPAAYLTGTNFNVVMSGGGQPCNVYWWVADYATLTDSVFIGNILAGGYITVTRGTFNGDTFAQAAVTLTGPGALTGCGTGTPQPPPIKVTGGGQITVRVADSTGGGRATFGFNAQPDELGGAKGHLNYVNHVTGRHVNGPVTSLQVIAFNPGDGLPKTVLFSGTCDGDLPACSFIVTVEDHGEPGTDDQFGITVLGGLKEFQLQRVIKNGNIQFHE